MKSPNIDGNVIDIEVTTAETTVPHGLGRPALEAFVLRKPGNGAIYRGPTAWNATNIFLRAGTTMTVRLLII